jgi:uncharacterized membrane protein YozB (DUF420 family)
MGSGFIPYSRASFMLDLVAVAMLAVVPVLAWSIYLARCRKNYSLHKRVQIVLGVALLATVCFFELDMRLHGWRQFATDSPYYESWVFPVLYIHLVFAVSTVLLWVYVIVTALRRFPSPPVPNEYSPRHRRIARLAAIDRVCTAVSGWVFYVLAFVA